MQVRLLSSGDEETLITAARKFNGVELNAGRAREILADPAFIMVVAETDDKLAGRIYGHVLHRLDQNDLFLYEVDVDEPERRKGVGRSMLDFVTALCQERGFGEWFVLTELANEAGNALYGSAKAAIEGSPANVFVRHIRRIEEPKERSAREVRDASDHSSPSRESSERIPLLLEPSACLADESSRPRKSQQRFARVVSTLGGVGWLPAAPGTWASLVALPLAWLILHTGGKPLLLEFTVLVTALGTWATDIVAKTLGETDPQECVIDELAGQWLTCIFAPLSLAGFFLSFVLFRLFDVAKPWPVSAAERLSGGFGIMADDIVAGLMGGILVATAYAAGLG